MFQQVLSQSSEDWRVQYCNNVASSNHLYFHHCIIEGPGVCRWLRGTHGLKQLNGVIWREWGPP